MRDTKQIVHEQVRPKQYFEPHVFLLIAIQMIHYL